MNKKEVVYKDLQAKIITQKLLCGTRLNEKELMDQYTIGRTPLREVFMKLQLDSLIETIPQSGTFIKKLDQTEIKETLEMRIPLEILAASFVPLRITKEQLNKIHYILFNLQKNINSLTISEFKNETNKIHSIYYESVGNKKLEITLKQLHNISARTWFAKRHKMRSMQDTINDWEKRIKMIENQEITKLQKEVKSHIHKFAKLIGLEDVFN